MTGVHDVVCARVQRVSPDGVHRRPSRDVENGVRGLGRVVRGAVASQAVGGNVADRTVVAHGPNTFRDGVGGAVRFELHEDRVSKC